MSAYRTFLTIGKKIRKVKQFDSFSLHEIVSDEMTFENSVVVWVVPLECEKLFFEYLKTGEKELEDKLLAEGVRWMDILNLAEVLG